MKNLEITIGQELTLGELAELMGIDYSQVDDFAIWQGEMTNIDNFDGNQGDNVYFEVLEKEEDEDFYQSNNWKIKVTDIDQL